MTPDDGAPPPRRPRRVSAEFLGCTCAGLAIVLLPLLVAAPERHVHGVPRGTLSIMVPREFDSFGSLPPVPWQLRKTQFAVAFPEQAFDHVRWTEMALPQRYDGIEIWLPRASPVPFRRPWVRAMAFTLTPPAVTTQPPSAAFRNVWIPRARSDRYTPTRRRASDAAAVYRVREALEW